MATRQQAKKIAESKGAILTEPETFDGISYSVEAEAPDGKRWATGPISLVARFWPKQDKNSKAQAYSDLIDRMEHDSIESYTD